MKKAIFQRFIVIILLALILCGSIFTVSISGIIKDRAEKNMLYTVRIADHALDYNENLKHQVDLLKKADKNANSRYTIITLKGDVIADSDVSDSSGMENHSNREEVRSSLKTGTGYAVRRSETLNKSMLYVAVLSKTGQHVLRIAVPYSGMEQYIGIIIPAIAISIGISLIISLILADRFAHSVTKPLNEIAEEMQKLKEERPEFQFTHYKYDEMNSIAETTLRMTKAMKDSMNKIEFERMIRQEFFANASHELKTPLTSIRGYLELIDNGMVKDEAMQKGFIQRIKNETENMTNLINDILMISRLETKEAEVIITDVRIYPLLAEICDSLKPLAEENQVTINMNCMPITMRANTQQLRELFNNLIMNAIKYNKPGGKVDITVLIEAKELVITVADTGVGIPEDSKQRIFERFYRVDKGRSKKVGGTGLGLSIVKHIINFYEGSIEVESKLKQGSRFTVRLPMKEL